MTDSRHVSSIRLAEQVLDFALSPCGGYVAIADASGSLNVYKSTGDLLFTYPIVQLGSTDRYVAQGPRHLVLPSVLG